MDKVRLTTENVADICRILAHLLQAGIAPADALVLLARDETQPAWQALFSAMARRCDEGAPVHTALREEGCFPAYVWTLLEIGNRTGQTAGVLEALADYYDGRARMDRRLKAALTYPAMLLTVLLAVVAALFIWVLPVFDDVYTQLGSPLTGFAGGLLALGEILRAMLPGICVFLAVILLAAAIPPVRRKALHLLAACWGDRGALAQVNSARFVQALSLCIASGMTDREAAEQAGSLAAGEGAAFGRRGEAFLALLDEGTDLPQALLRTRFITAGACRLLEAGRRSGQGDRAMTALAGRMLEKAEEDLEQAAGRIEPAVIAVACVLIGGVLLSVMLPLVQIMNAIG